MRRIVKEIFDKGNSQYRVQKRLPILHIWYTEKITRYLAGHEYIDEAIFNSLNDAFKFCETYHKPKIIERIILYKE